MFKKWKEFQFNLGNLYIFVYYKLSSQEANKMKDTCINKIFFDWTVDIVLVEGIFTVGVFERGNIFGEKFFVS